MKLFILLLVMSNSVHAAKVVTIDSAKYAFDVMNVTAKMDTDSETPQANPDAFNECVRDNVENGYGHISSEKWCKKHYKDN
jgi:hypothetical protein